MDAFFNLIKPPGMTSHDAVNFLRRWVRNEAGQRVRVGHAGTLDPGAAGVLVIATGFATRVLEFMDDRKAYRAELRLGTTTDTEDAQGNVVECRSISDLARQSLEETLVRFIGPLTQRPPAYSAVQIEGRRAYSMARSGIRVVVPSRQVNVFSLKLVRYRNDPTPSALIDVECSGGTYIRSLVRDLGESLGCGAHLGFLLRRRSGPFHLSEAVTLEEIQRANRQAALGSLAIPLHAGIRDIPLLSLATDSCRRLLRGQAVMLEPGEVALEHEGLAYVEDQTGRPVAMTRAAWEDERFRLRPIKVAEPTT